MSAVDISPEQAAIARHDGFPVQCENVLSYLEGVKTEFDLLVAIMDLVEHFQKNESVSFLSLCHRAVKAGGRLILQTPNAASPWGMDSRYNDRTHEVCFNPSLLSRVLIARGF